MKKCYCTHWVMTHPKFIAQILQHGGILNIDISYSLGFCFFGKTFHLERLCLKVKQSVVYDWNRKVCLDVWSQLPVSHTCHYSQAARTLAAPRVHLLPSPFFLWGQGRLRSNHQTLHRHRNYYRHSSSFQKKSKHMEAPYESIWGHELPNWPVMVLPYTTIKDATWTLSKYISCSFCLGLGDMVSWEEKINQ